MLAAVGEVGVDKGNGVSTWQIFSNIFLSLSINKGGKRVVFNKDVSSVLFTKTFRSS